MASQSFRLRATITRVFGQRFLGSLLPESPRAGDDAASGKAASAHAQVTTAPPTARARLSN